MYSGLVLTKYSGRFMGAHQKIDRVARRHFSKLAPETTAFPKIKEILKFEGKNGPDGIKRKSPGRDEPWHFLNPLGDDNQQFLKIICDHYNDLVKGLKHGNRERAAFESAWLAHAIVDGLTPAHHFPYEEKVAEMRTAGGNESRDTISEKLIFKGDTRSKTLFNTYKAYGPRGLLTAHVLFEWGFMLLIRPLRLPDAMPSKRDIKEFKDKGPDGYFMNRAREVAVLDMFNNYLHSGWTPKLSNQIRHQLAPSMVRTVVVMWYCAAQEAGI